MEQALQESIEVLHVDDDPDFVELAATFVEREDDRFTVRTATGADEAVDRLEEELVDFVVSDYEMPGQNGIEFLKTVRERSPDLPFVLFTGKGSEEIASEAISAGVSDYLQKGTGTERYELLANRILTHVEQARTQQELEEREAHLRQAQTVADLGSWKLDLTTEELYWSSEVYHIFGVPEDESVSYTRFLDHVYPEDRDTVEAAWTAALEGAEYDIEHRIVTDDGTTRWVHQRAEFEVDESGNPNSAFGVIQDITEFKQREQRLREERDRREALFRNPTDPIIEFEFHEETPIIVTTNGAFTEVFGFEAGVVAGKPASEILIPADEESRTRHQEIKQQVLDGEPVDTTVSRLTRDGPREFLLRVFPIDTTDGRRGSYAIYTDVTGDIG